MSLLYLTKVITFVSFHDTGMWQLIIMTIQTLWDVSRISWDGAWGISMQCHQLYSPISVSVIWLHSANSHCVAISRACLSVVLRRAWTLASPTLYIIIFVICHVAICLWDLRSDFSDSFSLCLITQWHSIIISEEEQKSSLCSPFLIRNTSVVKDFFAPEYDTFFFKGLDRLDQGWLTWPPQKLFVALGHLNSFSNTAQQT